MERDEIRAILKKRDDALFDPEVRRDMRADAVAKFVGQLPTIDRIYELLGKPVLVAIDYGQKRPVGSEWQKLTFADTETPEYQSKLREYTNTGVLLGAPSGNLIAIDFDDNDTLMDFIGANPNYVTFTTRGARGGQVWYFIDGDYPQQIRHLKKKDDEGKPVACGEWRGGGAQSVIRGIHPNRHAYQWLQEQPPTRIKFAWLKWPEYLILPWEKERKCETSRDAKSQSTTSTFVRKKSKRVILDDSQKVPIQLPGGNRLSSDFCAALGSALAPHDFYARGNQVMQPRFDPSTGTSALVKLTPPEFVTSIEAIVVPFTVDDNNNRQPQTLNIKLAPSVLASQDLIEQLNPVQAVNTVRLPILRPDGNIEILREGYDETSGILTLINGKDWLTEPIEFTLPEAAQYWRDLLSEFCFHPEDCERSLAIVVAGALTLFCRHLFAPEVMRPAFLFTGNAEGCGKTLLAKIVQIATLGLTPVRTAPSTNDEFEKILLSKVLTGGSALFLDNLKGTLSSPALEAILTSAYFEGRILGASKEARMQHGLTCFITGNGLHISPDLRRRILHIDLFLAELRAENRKIKRNLEDSTLSAEKQKMLFSMLTMVNSWCNAGKPAATQVNQSFLPWSQIIGGITEHAGFASPCTANKFGESGDSNTRDAERLFGLLNPDNRRGYKFPDVVYICAKHGLFANVIPENGDLDASQRSICGKLFRSYVDRVIGIRKLTMSGVSRDTHRFHITVLT